MRMIFSLLLWSPKNESYQSSGKQVGHSILDECYRSYTSFSSPEPGPFQCQRRYQAHRVPCLKRSINSVLRERCLLHRTWQACRGWHASTLAAIWPIHGRIGPCSMSLARAPYDRTTFFFLGDQVRGRHCFSTRLGMPWYEQGTRSVWLRV
jgi:hypothetical protein